ncbi:hypothetical protein V8C37DRAFT_369530 [Trichoderma ceciliae]
MLTVMFTTVRSTYLAKQWSAFLVVLAAHAPIFPCLWITLHHDPYFPSLSSLFLSHVPLSLVIVHDTILSSRPVVDTHTQNHSININT